MFTKRKVLSTSRWAFALILVTVFCGCDERELKDKDLNLAITNHLNISSNLEFPDRRLQMKMEELGFSGEKIQDISKPYREAIKYWHQLNASLFDFELTKDHEYVGDITDYLRNAYAEANNLAEATKLNLISEDSIFLYSPYEAIHVLLDFRLKAYFKIHELINAVHEDVNPDFLWVKVDSNYFVKHFYISPSDTSLQNLKVLFDGSPVFTESDTLWNENLPKEGHFSFEPVESN